MCIPHALICRKFNTNVPHIHNIASQTMRKVYFETFQSLQLTNIVILMIHLSTPYNNLKIASVRSRLEL